MDNKIAAVLLVLVVAVVALILSLRPSPEGATFVPMQFCDDPFLQYHAEGYERCVQRYAQPATEYSGYSQQPRRYDTI